MDTVTAHLGTFVTKESVIGTIGNTGNAAGMPYIFTTALLQSSLGDWRFDKKMLSFYINPITGQKRTYLAVRPYSKIHVFSMSLSVFY